MYQEIIANVQRDVPAQFESDMIALLEQTGFLQYHSTDVQDVSNPKHWKTWFTVIGTDYLFQIDNTYTTWNGFRCRLYKGDKSNYLYSFTSGDLQGNLMGITMRFIKTDSLKMMHLLIVDGVTIRDSRDYGIFSLCSDGSWLSVEPIDSVDYSFHKKYFAKRDTLNNILLTPARLVNNVNKLVQVYPTSCYYCNTTGLTNMSFYTFTDGEIGYYKSNIIFK